MCGIVGICSLDGSPVSPEILRRMLDVLSHRGPDARGVLVAGPVGLGNARLAVIDPSPAGRQPIAAGDAVLLSYNGEIYDFAALRSELEAAGHRFESKTDSEVVARAWSEWGEGSIARLNGMFAFALWDRRLERLFLVRDRYGVKPLYYHLDSRRLVFASEIKALLAHPTISARISHDALGEYFTFQNVFSDLTLFEGVRLLPAGTVLEVSPRDGSRVGRRRYWDFDFRSDADAPSFEECVEELDRLFRRAVARQVVADAPLGAYLSGGIDSGSIASVASTMVAPLRTFTCGFDLSSVSGLELAFDERDAARSTALRLGTDHREIVLRSGDMERILPELVWHLEDLRVGQCYPNHTVAGLAGRSVKVVLSGIGGDELFAGYPWRYRRGRGAVDAESHARASYEYWQRLVPDGDRRAFYRADTLAAVGAREPYEVFRSVLAGYRGPLETEENRVDASLYFEAKTFLHGLLLVEDKLSMAHSLETRVPFLDNDLVDFALRVPARFKLRDLRRAPRVDENEPGKTLRYRTGRTSDGKRILRRMASRLLPEEVAGAAKQGFAAPDATWFRGASVDSVNRLLRVSTARIYEFFQPAYVRRVLDEHAAGEVNHRLLIWSLASFEWWCRRFLTGEGREGGSAGRSPEVRWTDAR